MWSCTTSLRSGSTTRAKNRDSREHHRTLSHPRWSRLATRPRTLRHYRNPVTELALSCAPNASAWYASDFLTTYPRARATSLRRKNIDPLSNLLSTGVGRQNDHALKWL